MELFNFTSGAFATADSKYKYNDAGVDYAGSPQSRVAQRPQNLPRFSRPSGSSSEYSWSCP